MEGEETLKQRGSIAAPIIFIIVIVFQLFGIWLQHMKKKASTSGVEIELRNAIKELLKEASSLSQPSTFAQAAKLRRLAATKEKELANYQESHSKEMKMSYGSYQRVLLISKVLIHLALTCWFWSASVANIPHQLVQPFGKVLSWRAGSTENGYIKVGIIPWLILSTRVSKFVCRVFR